MTTFSDTHEPSPTRGQVRGPRNPPSAWGWEQISRTKADAAAISKTKAAAAAISKTKAAAAAISRTKAAADLKT